MKALFGSFRNLDGKLCINGFAHIRRKHDYDPQGVKIMLMPDAKQPFFRLCHGELPGLAPVTLRHHPGPVPRCRWSPFSETGSG